MTIYVWHILVLHILWKTNTYYNENNLIQAHCISYFSATPQISYLLLSLHKYIRQGGSAFYCYQSLYFSYFAYISAIIYIIVCLSSSSSTRAFVYYCNNVMCVASEYLYVLAIIVRITDTRKHYSTEIDVRNDCSYT